jgi:hypothetical protein
LLSAAFIPSHLFVLTSNVRQRTTVDCRAFFSAWLDPGGGTGHRNHGATDSCLTSAVGFTKGRDRSPPLASNQRSAVHSMGSSSVWRPSVRQTIFVTVIDHPPGIVGTLKHGRVTARPPFLDRHLRSDQGISRSILPRAVDRARARCDNHMAWGQPRSAPDCSDQVKPVVVPDDLRALGRECLNVTREFEVHRLAVFWCCAQ